MLSIRVGHVSVTGNYRDNNEDSCYLDGKQRLFIVADGMGGQSAGERASAMAVEVIPGRLEPLFNSDKPVLKNVTAALEKAIVAANSEILLLSEEPGLRNMGTTAVLMVNVGDTFYFMGVGDSRAYELRGTKLRQLTVDHSITQALLDSGTINAEEAKTHRYRNVLYKYLGCRDGATGAAVVEVNPRPGDRFLLCSDGLNDGLSDSEIARLLRISNDPQVVAEQLVKAALDAGSRDNVTSLVILVD